MAEPSRPGGRVIPIRQAAAAADPEAERHERLLREGWRRQTTIGEPRLSELVENYRAMGYEVEVVEHRASGDGCNTCFDAGQEMGQFYGTVYVRKGGTAAADDELF